MGCEINEWRVEAERFADVQLLAELQRITRVDRKCEARMLVLLAEMDERELFLAQGYSSLFRYAVSVLRMSEAQAYLRIGAARTARSYPLALEMLIDGVLNLSTVKVLAPQLTAENHATLFERARGKSKREVELLVAEIAPKPDVQTRVRKLPERSSRTGSARSARAISSPRDQVSLGARATATADSAPRAAAVAPAAERAAAGVAQRSATDFALEAPRASCAVLSPGRYKLELTVDHALFEQMMTLKLLLKHRVPSGELGVILGLAITELSGMLRKQRFAEVSKPVQISRNDASDAPSARAAEVRDQRRSRYVPRAVVRAVFARDGAQCTFVSADGRRCAERGMLELHHVKAFGRGGAQTLENLKVVCRSHNGYFAKQDYGAAHMRKMRVQAS